MARDPQASMRRHSGTLDIDAWNNPEQYEAEYQCVASNMYGSAYSNKIRLRLYSKSSRGGRLLLAQRSCASRAQWPLCCHGDSISVEAFAFI